MFEEPPYFQLCHLHHEEDNCWPYRGEELLIRFQHSSYYQRRCCAITAIIYQQCVPHLHHLQQELNAINGNLFDDLENCNWCGPNLKELQLTIARLMLRFYCYFHQKFHNESYYHQKIGSIPVAIATVLWIDEGLGLMAERYCQLHLHC